jgi:hypothetical protein
MSIRRPAVCVNRGESKSKMDVPNSFPSGSRHPDPERSRMGKDPCISESRHPQRSEGPISGTRHPERSEGSLYFILFFLQGTSTSILL